MRRALLLLLLLTVPALAQTPAERASALNHLLDALKAAPSEEVAAPLEQQIMLNLVQAGLINHVSCTDISPGMVETLTDNARRLGLGERVSGTRADAESLPFADASFDLVLGHAVLHHLPDLKTAFDEFHRVLRPGGRIIFAAATAQCG